MTTVIKAPSATFKKSTLLTAKPIVRNGLRAAYRFVGSNKLTDLSGNNRNLSAVKNDGLDVGFTDTGVLLNTKTYLTTPLPETKDLTYIAVFRTLSSLPTDRHFLLGSYLSNEEITDFFGSSIYSTDNLTNLTFQQSTKNVTTGDYKTNRSVIVKPQTTGYMFVAMTLDSASETVRGYSAGSGKPLTNIGSYTEGPGFSFNSRVLRAEADLNIGGAPSVWKWQVNGLNTEISEVLVYDRALSESEIEEQYRNSREALSLVGVDI